MPPLLTLGYTKATDYPWAACPGRGKPHCQVRMEQEALDQFRAVFLRAPF